MQAVTYDLSSGVGQTDAMSVFGYTLLVKDYSNGRRIGNYPVSGCNRQEHPSPIYEPYRPIG